MRFVAVAFLLLVGVTPGAASYITGRMLGGWCENKQTQLLNGYVTGVVDRTEGVMSFIDSYKSFRPQMDQKDAAVLREGTALLCVSDKATVGQLSEIVCLYIARNPSERHLPAQTLVTRALHAAFPCPPE